MPGCRSFKSWEGSSIIRAGEHAKVVLFTALEAGVEVAGLLDDNRGKWGRRVWGFAVWVPLSLLNEQAAGWAVLAIGDNAARKRLSWALQGVRWATSIHPNARMHPSPSLGEGTVVFAGAGCRPWAYGSGGW